MTPRWERAPAPPHFEADALFMDAVLRPHRSLSLAAFKLLFGVFIAMNLAVAAFFLAQGAFPVAGFLGLDVLAVWLAFRWSYRGARRVERSANNPACRGRRSPSAPLLPSGSCGPAGLCSWREIW